MSFQQKDENEKESTNKDDRNCMADPPVNERASEVDGKTLPELPRFQSSSLPHKSSSSSLSNDDKEEWQSSELGDSCGNITPSPQKKNFNEESKGTDRSRSSGGLEQLTPKSPDRNIKTTAQSHESVNKKRKTRYETVQPKSEEKITEAETKPDTSASVEWTHGQLVWWNRFLANRKRSQGNHIGNYVGRTVDLECEWFPGTDMTATRNYLKDVASSMGRRTLIIQSLGEMKYMVIPPRSLVASFSEHKEQQAALLEGLKQYGSLNALRGLRRAEMIEEIRLSTGGKPNTDSEIQFLALCLEGSDGRMANRQCTLEELDYLKSVSVWDILKTKDMTGHSLHKQINSSTTDDPSLPEIDQTNHINRVEKEEEQPQQLLEQQQPEEITVPSNVITQPQDEPLKKISLKKKTNSPLNVKDKPEKQSLTPQVSQKTMDSSEDCDPLTAGRPGQNRRKHLSQNPSETLERSIKRLGLSHDVNQDALKSMPESNESCVSDAKGVRATSLRPSHCHNFFSRTIENTLRHMVQRICVGYSELVHLFSGIPLVLLCNQTGVNLPEEIPTYSFKVLEHVFSYTSNNPKDPINLPRGRVLALHLYMSNIFLHKLFRTIAVRVECSSFQHSTPTSNPSPLNPVIGPSDGSKNQSISVTNKSAEQLTSPMNTKPTSLPEQPYYSVFFSLDHTHQSPISMSAKDEPASEKPANEKPRDLFSTQACSYNLKVPFKCASFPTSFLKPHYHASPTEKHNRLPVPQQNTQQDTHQDTPQENKTDSKQQDTKLHTPFNKEAPLTAVPLYSLCQKSTLRFIGVGSTAARIHASQPLPTPPASFYVLNLSKVSDCPPLEEELNQAVDFIIRRGDSRVTVISIEKRVEVLQNLRDVAQKIRSVYEKQIQQQYQTSQLKETKEHWLSFESQWTDIYRKLR